MKKKPLLFRLTKRVTLFLFLLLIALIIVYITGNFQKFLDSTQKLILTYAMLVSIALILFSILSIVESLIFMIAQRRLEMFFYLVPFALCIVVSLIIIALAGSILFISDSTWLESVRL